MLTGVTEGEDTEGSWGRKEGRITKTITKKIPKSKKKQTTQPRISTNSKDEQTPHTVESQRFSKEQHGKETSHTRDDQ